MRYSPLGKVRRSGPLLCSLICAAVSLLGKIVLEEPDETIQRDQQTNTALLKSMEAAGFSTLDLYDYVNIRRTDMLDSNGGLNPPGKELAASVVAGAILDELEREPPGELPVVLIMGDSIANGYHLPLKNELEDVAVVRLAGTAFGPNPDWPSVVRHAVQSEGGSEKPAAITFNWGLHALKFVDEGNRLATPETGERCVPLERYGAELTELARELKKRDVPVFWISTTPENGATWAKPGDAALYNEVASEVMARKGIPVIDLHAFVAGNPVPQIPNDCHFKTQGSKELAERIARSLTPIIRPGPEVSP